MLANDTAFGAPGGLRRESKAACLDGRTLWQLREVPPTGRAARLAYIQVLRSRDGTHVSLNSTFDRLSMPEPLGLLPAQFAAM